MFQQIPTRRRSWSRAGVLALGLVLLVHAGARGQVNLRQSLATPGDSSPIQLEADDITTWPVGGKQIFLLKGRVWIEQGVVNVRGPQAVVWVDQAGHKDSGVYNLQVYGETLTLEDGQKSQTGQTALLDMGTRGEVRVKSYANKVAQTALPADALYQRAAAALQAATAAAAPPARPLADFQGNPIQQVSGQGPAQAGLGTPGTFPQLTGVTPLDPGTPARIDNNIQQVQGLAQAPPIVTPVPADGPVSAPPPVLPPPAPIPSGMSPLTAPAGNGGPKQLNIRQRGAEPIAARNYLLSTGETAVVINTGVIISITDPVSKKVLVDIEADRVCFWTKGNSQQIFSNLRAPQGETTRSLEFYLSGNVEIRNQTINQVGMQTKVDTQTIRAEEAYYDVNRNVAIAIRADMEFTRPTLPYPIHFKSEELQQLNAKLFLAKQAEVYSTVLPSDPGLKIQIREAHIEEIDTVKQSIFGHTVIDNKTGLPVPYKQFIFTGDSDVVRFEGVPIFYTPYLKADVQRPLGPLDTASVGYNRIFGFELLTTWDLYELLGLQRPPGDHWKLFLDYMSARGPALGTEYDLTGKNMLGLTNKFEGLIKLYGIYDHGLDILGGNRGQEILINANPETFVPISHPDLRGRIFGNLNVQELDNGFSAQFQLAALSDRNFLEQFYPGDFQTGPQQESFLYVKQQNNIWAWTFLAEANFQPWMTTVDWLPKADGHVLGLKIFDLLTYNAQASIGFGQLRPTNVVPFAYTITDQRDNTGRADFSQEVSLPFAVGDVKLVPYGVVDLTGYTEDLNGDPRGRFYGGAGLRASVPFSRLYPDVHSDLFNVNGIFHKIVASANFYVAHSDTPFTLLPQLDQLNDNTSDQALRDIRPWQPLLNPANATILQSPVFDPQLYALRRLVDTSVDTLDSMEVLQLDLRQRWQTKRGFPGDEHVIDWMTLDVQASIFPRAQRDNFGSYVGDIEYDWVWNVGDRTALVSSGWFEPIDNGPRVFNLGTYISRPDRTTFYLGYRQIDPLNSRAVIASITYAFSAKYALTFSSTFDFGNNIQSNTLLLSRIGTDVTVSMGIGYNSIVNTFGVQFQVVPNLLPMSGGPGFGGFGTPTASR